MTDSANSEWSFEYRVARPRPDANDNLTLAAAPQPRRRTKTDFAHYRTSPWASLVTVTFSIAIIVILWIGWRNRDDNGLTPESGIGYWLGIAGSGLMLALLIYPLRKRMPALRAIGSVPFWFRAHMTLGVFGCVLILWHANFRLGSINSNVALFAMLVVAASGIVGRYLYGKIHRGLYGRKAAVREILADAEALRGFVGAALPFTGEVVAELKAFTEFGMAAPKGLLATLVLLPVINLQGSLVRMRLIAHARQVTTAEGKRLGWSRRVRRRRLAQATALVRLHVAAVKKAAAFAFYDRLFSIWHVLHAPLFFLLVIAAIIHVYAAHFF
jgi:hypothetical protein